MSRATEFLFRVRQCRLPIDFTITKPASVSCSPA